MSSEPEDSFKVLEDYVMADMREIYSEKVIDHAMNPRNLGVFRDADGFAQVTGPCGDTIQICLKAKNGRINDATFTTDGCGATIACGSMITELVKGRAITEALKITPDDIFNSLDGLPEGNVHCALLAVNTLKEALKDYLSLHPSLYNK